MNPKLWWYVARASGLVTWVLVTCAVIWGLALSGRVTKRPRPAWVLDLHRFLGTLSIVFLGVHLSALVADNFTHFGPAELLLPMASRWRPGAVAWGIVGLYLLVAIEATSLVKRRMTEPFGTPCTSRALPCSLWPPRTPSPQAPMRAILQCNGWHWCRLPWSSFLLIYRLLTFRARREGRARRLEGISTVRA